MPKIVIDGIYSDMSEEEQKERSIARAAIMEQEIKENAYRLWNTDVPIKKGQYFEKNGDVFFSVTDISAGDRITVGSNCISINVSDALNALNV